MRPDKFSYTLILSSPANFPGEVGSEHFFLTHAWPDFSSWGHEMDPKSCYSRKFFALTFRERELSPEEEKEFQLPNYSFVGDFFSVFLSLYFGKRFDNLGFHLENGSFRLPNVEPVRPRKSSQAFPFSSNPRKDLAIPLMLSDATSLVPVLNSIFGDVTRERNREGSLSDDLILAYTAGRFYQQALQMYDTDPEFAFISLVNAGEVVVSGLAFEDRELYDEKLMQLLADIQTKAGQSTYEQVKKRLFQVRRKFTQGLAKLLNPVFFAGSESTMELFSFKSESIEKHLKAAYDLRSRFLHAGTRFGHWVSIDIQGAEVSVGTPAYGERKWKKLLSIVPTLGGLERLIRFCLLRFVHQRVSPLNPLLD